MADNTMPWWVKAGLGAFVLFLLGGALGLTYATGDTSNRSILIGAIIALASSVGGYYFGSSDSSQKKDATIASQSAALATSAPLPQLVEPERTN